jgi:integrase
VPSTSGYLPRNPFAVIREVKSLSPCWHHIKPGELSEILKVVADLRWRAFYWLAYTTGARFGELFNLRWTDVDLDKGTIRIESRAGTGEMPPFKVKDFEARTLLIPPQTVEALRSWQTEAAKEVPYVLLTLARWKQVQSRWHLCRTGQPWIKNKKTGRLECGEWENRYMVNNVIRNMRCHARKANLKPTAPLTVHTLRKSFAQNHADAGTPMATLKTLLGHSSIMTTQQFYLQKSSDSEVAAVKRYESLLPKICVQFAYGQEKGENKPSSTIPNTAVNPTNSES